MLFILTNVDALEQEYISPEDQKLLREMGINYSGSQFNSLYPSSSTSNTQTQQQNKTNSTQSANLSGSNDIIPLLYNATDQEIIEMKKKSREKRKIVEGNEPINFRTRIVLETPTTFPEIRLIKGYATAIHLPYSIKPDRIGFGNASAFDVKVEGNTLIIFPLQNFRTTNLFVFDENGSLHQFILNEDLISDYVDLSVTVVKSDQLPDLKSAVTDAILTGNLPNSETLQGMVFTGRSPKMLNGVSPVIRKITLSSPQFTVYLLDDKYMPISHVSWYFFIDHKRTIVATAGESISVRRVSDGKIININ